MGCLPTRRAASGAGSSPLKDREATSVSRTTTPEDRSGKVGVAGLGDEGKERFKLLIGVEHVATQLVDRADGVGTGRLPDQLLKGHEVGACWLLRVLGAAARRDHLHLASP